MKTKTTFFLVALFFLLSGSLTFAQQTVTHGPVVGGVTSGSAKFLVRTDDAALVFVSLSEDSLTWSNPIFSNGVTTDVEQDFFAILDVVELSPNTLYYYRAEINEAFAGGTIGRFKTFPPEGEAATFTFTFGSCQQAIFDDPVSGIGNIFPIIAKDDALFFLHQGDWIYPDTTDSEQDDPLNYFSKDLNLLYDSYQTRYNPSFPMADLLRVLSVDYVYDDHDWVNNNCDGTYMDQGGSNTISVYQKASPHYPLASASNGVWHKFSCGNADFFIVDNRAQRDPNMNALTWIDDRYIFTANYEDDHSILGEEQMNWLIQELQNSTATWKFISSGTPFNPAIRGAIELALLLQGSEFDPFPDPATGELLPMAFLAEEFADKWGGFPSDIYKLLSTIISNNIENVIFLSGDTHTSGMDDGKNSLIPEIMAGPLDRTNSQLVAISKELFLVDMFNKGGHTYDNPFFPDLGNAYGRVTISGDESVLLEVVSESENVLASYVVPTGYVPRNVAGGIFPGGLDFGEVPINEMGESAVVAVSTSIDTFKISNVIVNKISGNSQIVPVETSASLASGEAKIFGFGFIPVGDIGETTQGFISFQTNDPGKVHLILFQGVIGDATGISSPEPNSFTYELKQNYPNPFNPTTAIEYSLAKQSNVEIVIYNTSGQLIETLLKSNQRAGTHTVSWNAGDYASGVYFYQLKTGSFVETKKMLLLR